jgi:hypothetical protein
MVLGIDGERWFSTTLMGHMVRFTTVAGENSTDTEYGGTAVGLPGTRIDLVG